MPAQEWVEESLARRPGWASRLIDRFCRQIAFGQILVRHPNGGATLHQGRFDGGSGIMEIHSSRALLMRLLTRGDIGFAEAYIEGHWSTPDLAALLEVLYDNMEHLGVGSRGMRWSRVFDRLTHRLRDNHRARSRRNIAHHYDLGNDFYECWLDPSMTYSSALFADRENEELECAQGRKYQRLLDALNTQPGEHILEIGCGWGGFAEFAARRGLRVTAVTLSHAQLQYARERLATAGLADLVDIRLQDYRDIQGEFDHVVSIEMIEAVGESYWPTYYKTLRRLVRPGGRIGLQAITINEDDFPIYRKQPDFVQLYIFPGGMLPTAQRLDILARDTGLVVRDSAWFGLDYAETLRRWRIRFDALAPEIERLGYDAAFRRMWRYYLAYCETGFKTGCTDLGQIVLEAPATTPPVEPDRITAAEMKSR